jgi:hypothetical protein
MALGSHWGRIGVALGWLWVPNRLPTACLPNGFGVALIWPWVALPGLGGVGTSAALVPGPGACRRLTVSLMYVTRPGGGWRRPREYESYLRRDSQEAPRHPASVWLMQLRFLSVKRTLQPRWAELSMAQVARRGCRWGARSPTLLRCLTASGGGRNARDNSSTGDH